MRPHATFVLVWVVTGVCAALGSMLGGAVGDVFLYIGAIVGGVLGAIAGVSVAVRLHCLAREESRFAAIGGIAGFAIAVPIAVLNLHTPVTPILSCALAGAGALVGAGLSRRR